MKTIFDVVKETVSVPEAAGLVGIRAGRNGMALCPFHDDHNPSLRLYEDHFYCFGCGAHGDVIDLISRSAGLRPIEAARRLASLWQIPDPNPTRQNRPEP